jgi:uncharacterized SAM-dependent methyltransferase
MLAKAQRQARPTGEPESFLEDMLTALAQRPRQISPKYLYDEIGSRLFERICAPNWASLNGTAPRWRAPWERGCYW